MRALTWLAGWLADVERCSCIRGDPLLSWREVWSKAGRFMEGLHMVGGIAKVFKDKYQMMFHS
jgi:hypothetical protein